MIIIAIITILIILMTVSCALVLKKQTRPKDIPQGFVIIPCSAATKELEMTVRSAYWNEMLEAPDRRRTVLIVLMNAGANEYTARRLEAELTNVEAVDISALRDRIARDGQAASDA